MMAVELGALKIFFKCALFVFYLHSHFAPVFFPWYWKQQEYEHSD